MDTPMSEETQHHHFRAGAYTCIASRIPADGAAVYGWPEHWTVLALLRGKYDRETNETTFGRTLTDAIAAAQTMQWETPAQRRDINWFPLGEVSRPPRNGSAGQP
jgi:hypothetical protein